MNNLSSAFRVPLSRAFGAAMTALFAGALAATCVAAQPLSAVADSVQSEPIEQGAYVEGQLLIRFNAGASVGQREAALAAVGTLASGYALQGNSSQVVLVTLSDGLSVSQAQANLKAFDAVAETQPNMCYVGGGLAQGETIDPLAPSPMMSTLVKTKVNDPYAQSLMKSSGANQWGLGCTNAMQAWDSARCEGKVAVAVLDTGCNITHQDLKARIVKSQAYDAVTQRRMTDYYNDWMGSGSAECGIIAAQANNGVGIAGISYNADLVPVNIFDYSVYGQPSSQYTTSAILLAAYDHLYDAQKAGVNVRVAQLGLANLRYRAETEDFLLQQKIIEAKDEHGIVTVAGSGDGDNYESSNMTVYPSDFDEVVSVVPLFDQSTYNDPICYGDKKNICAPGKDISSVDASSNNAYRKYSGSKYAASLVAGSLALLFAVNDDLTCDEATEMLYSTATDLGDPGFDQFYGWGRLNVGAAVEKAIESNPDYINLADAKVSVEEKVTYTGSPTTPKVKVTYNGRELQEGVHYAVRYANNVNAGTAQAIVSGIGCAASAQSTDYEIAKASAPNLTLEDFSKIYDGQAVEVSPSVDADAQNTTFEYKYPDGSYQEKIPRMTQAGTYILEARSVNPNYESAYASAVVAIDPAPVTLTAGSCEKHAGDADPEFTYTMEGTLVDPQDLGAITVTRDKADAGKEKAGDVVALVVSCEKNPNYAVTCVNGKMSIVSYGDTAPIDRFSDVGKDEWYVTQGWFSCVVERGIMSGYTDGSNRFGAYDSITRGQLITMLYRLHTGETAQTTNNQVSAGFSDVVSGSYCAAAAKWANKNGLVTGYDGTSEFRPDNAATRQEMVTIVARYAKFAGVDTSRFDRDVFLAFPDSNEVDGWARPSFAWCVSAGVVSGVDQANGAAQLMPGEPAQRAQAAKVITVLMRDILGK